MIWLHRTCVVIGVVLFSQTAAAQDPELRRWEPFGPVPVDEAGSGGRGYTLAGEGSDVLDPGASQLSLHTVVENFFYLENGNAFAISQRFEAHTFALDYQRGFRFRTGPRFEVGGQLQVQESDAGFLNGFITAFEDLVHAPLRSRLAVPPPPGMVIVQNGHVVYQTPMAGSGIGDVSLDAKAVLRDGDAGSRATRVAIRLAGNIRGNSLLSAGEFIGAGVSLDRTISGWSALHGDIRLSVPLDRIGVWSFPLRHDVLAYSWGPEFRVSSTTSLHLQIDSSTSPYRPTGAVGLDANYGNLDFGVSRRFTTNHHQVVVQAYAVENMNMPFRVRWNTDPDFAIGLKTTIR